METEVKKRKARIINKHYNNCMADLIYEYYLDDWKQKDVVIELGCSKQVISKWYRHFDFNFGQNIK